MDTHDQTLLTRYIFAAALAIPVVVGLATSLLPSVVGIWYAEPRFLWWDLASEISTPLFWFADDLEILEPLGELIGLVVPVVLPAAPWKDRTRKLIFSHQTD